MRQLRLPAATPRLLVPLALAATALATTVAVALPAAATAAPNASARAAAGSAPVAAAPNGYAGTIALNNCSGALVRFPTSVSSDRAMLLTNGHCYEGAMPAAGAVLVNRSSSRSGTLLSASGASLGTVRADLLLYATMTGNDVALYRLNETFASITSRYSATALTIAAEHPSDRTGIVIPSSYWKQTWNCSVNGFVPTLREDAWTWHDSIRYSTGCSTTHGTSGSPILDATSGYVVGINNTGNDDGAMCTLNNPCEVDANGSTTATKGQSYGQQTFWFTTCLTSANAIDLTKPGCLLTKPAGTPTQTPTSTPTSTPTGTPTTTPPSGQNLLLNPGFESGAASWTGTSGPVTINTGRPARTGSWKAWLGGNGSTATETVNQSVAVPASGDPTLSFWIRTDTAESGSTVYDTMKAQVVVGSTATTLATFTNVGTNASYTQKTYSLNAFKGLTVTIRFTATEDSSLQTSWVVDDTSLTG